MTARHDVRASLIVNANRIQSMGWPKARAGPKQGLAGFIHAPFLHGPG